MENAEDIGERAHWEVDIRQCAGAGLGGDRGTAGKHHVEGMALSGFIQAVFGAIPLGWLGTPEEVTPLAVFPASDESSFMVGQLLSAKRGPGGLARPQCEVGKERTPDEPSGVLFVSLSGLCRPPAYHWTNIGMFDRLVLCFFRRKRVCKHLAKHILT